MFVGVATCPPDAECVRQCLNGHPEAFRHLVGRYQDPLVRYLSGRLGNEDQAVEAAQEAMVRAYFALKKIRKPEAFYSWLLGIADRVAKETHRHNQRQRQMAADHDVAQQQEDRPLRPVRQAVAELPDVYRQVILLRDYGGLSCVQISREQGVPIGTVTKRLSRAYALLREALREPQ